MRLFAGRGWCGPRVSADSALPATVPIAAPSPQAVCPRPDAAHRPSFGRVTIHREHWARLRVDEAEPLHHALFHHAVDIQRTISSVRASFAAVLRCSTAADFRTNMPRSVAVVVEGPGEVGLIPSKLTRATVVPGPPPIRDGSRWRTSEGLPGPEPCARSIYAQDRVVPQQQPGRARAAGRGTRWQGLRGEGPAMGASDARRASGGNHELEDVRDRPGDTRSC
jgi:hypothetical protein